MKGWHEDGIASGNLVLKFPTATRGWDLEWTDIFGIHSMSGEGATITVSRPSEDTILFVANYGLGVTTYLFDLTNSEVAWTEARGDVRLKSAKLMVAQCVPVQL